MNKNIVVLGSQWGDEGKGKIVDFLTDKVEAVVRFQGGNNAGHTIKVGNNITKLRILPSGILHEHVKNFIANGVVICVEQLVNEIRELSDKGIFVKKNLKISEACPLVLPVHIALDKVRESFLNNNEIGTTKNGIGPAYEDKVARRAIRIGDLRDEFSLKEKLSKLLHLHNFLLEKYYKHCEIFDVDEILENLMSHKDIILPLLTDVSSDLMEIKNKKGKIIFEGAQGTLLDVDHGTYPFVTSSNTVSGTVSSGAGFGPCYIDAVIGVAKVYTTRVGKGAYPTELFNKTGDHLAKKGSEIGTVTGRKRRTGWLDLVALRRAIDINSITSFCLTKLDILDGLSTIKICIAYELDGKEMSYPPYDNARYLQCKPIYREFSGWNTGATYNIKNYNALPENAKIYISFIENFLNIPISIISTGPERSQNIILRSI